MGLREIVEEVSLDELCHFEMNRTEIAKEGQNVRKSVIFMKNCMDEIVNEDEGWGGIELRRGRRVW